MISSEFIADIFYASKLYATNTLAGLSGSLTILSRSALALWLVGVGLGMITQKIKIQPSTWLVTLVVLGLYHTLLLETSLYFDWFIEPITSTTINLSSFFIDNGDYAGGLPGLLKSLDSMYGTITQFAQDVVPEGGIMSWDGQFFVGILAALVLYFSYGLMYISFLVTIVLSIVCMYVLHALAGVMILFAAFSSTRRFFLAWLKSIIHYGSVVVIASIVIGICINGISGALNGLVHADVSSGIIIKETGKVVVWCLMAFALILKSADLASGITGAVDRATPGIASMMSIGTSMLMSKFMYARMGGGGAGGGGGSGGGALGNPYSKMRGVTRE